MTHRNEDQRLRLRVPVTPPLPVACPLLALVATCPICSSASGPCPDIVDRATIMSTLRPDPTVRAPSHTKRHA